MFGKLLKEARIKNKMSQEDLAKILGVNRVAISNYEQDKNTPTLSNLNKIREILKLSSDYFNDKKDKIKPTYRPLIGEASCGVPVTYHYDNSYEMITAPEGTGKDAYYIRADGDSMTPRINHGDLILCDPDQPVESGNIVHFEWDGEHGIKRYVEQGDLKMMIATNPAYSPIIITPEYKLRTVKCVKIMADL